MQVLNPEKLQKTLDIISGNIWARLIMHYPKLNKFETPKIVISNRLTKTAGYCTVDDRIVTIAAKFFIRDSNTPNMLFGILPHELIHQAVTDLYSYNPENGGHCDNWCNMMIAYGLPSNRYHYMKI